MFPRIIDCIALVPKPITSGRKIDIIPHTNPAIAGCNTGFIKEIFGMKILLVKE